MFVFRVESLRQETYAPRRMDARWLNQSLLNSGAPRERLSHHRVAVIHEVREEARKLRVFGASAADGLDLLFSFMHHKCMQRAKLRPNHHYCDYQRIISERVEVAAAPSVLCAFDKFYAGRRPPASGRLRLVYSLGSPIMRPFSTFFSTPATFYRQRPGDRAVSIIFIRP